MPEVALVVADAEVAMALAALGGRPGLPGFFFVKVPTSDPFYEQRKERIGDKISSFD